MRVLVLGGLGMLGHQLARTLSKQGETWATVRAHSDLELAGECLSGVSVFPGVDALRFETVAAALDEVRPDAIVNCIGIIKQDQLAKRPIPSIRINSLFPHLVSEYCQYKSIRFVHISTDCVFSGLKGNYEESDIPDANDLYGRTKHLGEVSSPDLTLRTSIIGPELRTSRSLLDWFTSQEGKVNGYTKAIFSGLTTLELSRVIARVLHEWEGLAGLYHLSADPISKHDLLGLVRDSFNLPMTIEPSDTLQIDRSLNSTRFKTITGYQPPSWPEMVGELAPIYSQKIAGGNYVITR